MGRNGIFTGFGIHRSTSLVRLLKINYPIKITWTLVTGLTTAAVAYIFAEGWHMPGKNFIALWALAWYVRCPLDLIVADDLYRVYCLICYSTFAFLVAVVPIAFLSSFVFPVVMTSGKPASCLVRASTDRPALQSPPPYSPSSYQTSFTAYHTCSPRTHTGTRQSRYTAMEHTTSCTSIFRSWPRGWWWGSWRRCMQSTRWRGGLGKRTRMRNITDCKLSQVIPSWPVWYSREQWLCCGQIMDRVTK